MLAAFYQDLAKHWEKARALGKPLEAAIVIGCTPNLSYCSAARVPQEYHVAGAIAGEPVDLVRCRTIDLMVPACSEIVIEGMIPTDKLEPEGPFGEFTGYMAHREPAKYLNVTCITRRQDAIFQAFLSQFPPSESSVIRGVALEGQFYKLLTVDHGIEGILEVALPEHAGGHGICIVKLDRSAAPRAMEALRAIADLPRGIPKILIAVDSDIDARDPELVNWAMAFRIQPHRDVETRNAPVMALDFSIAPPEERRRNRQSESLDPADRCHAEMGLPANLAPQEGVYGQGAVDLGAAGSSRQSTLKNPWFGYDLGYWS